jgi:hypothetical protein
MNRARIDDQWMQCNIILFYIKKEMPSLRGAVVCRFVVLGISFVFSKKSSQFKKFKRLSTQYKRALAYCSTICKEDGCTSS